MNVILCSRRNVADMTKDLEMRRLSWVSPNYYHLGGPQMPHMSQREIIPTHSREGNAKTGGLCSYKPRNITDFQETPGTRKGQERFLP